ncbi:MAG: hypothetical protein WEA80_04490 [Gemmatimonadaceae bacterium]
MIPEPHSRFEEIVLEFLRGLGYPSGSLVRAPSLLPNAGTQYRPDIGILDPAAKEYIAVLEVKGSNDSVAITTASDRLRGYVTTLSSRPLEAFVAVPGHGPDAISFYRMMAGGAFTLIPLSTFPRYSDLRSTSLASSRTAVRADIKRTTDRFRIVAWVVAAASFLLAVGDFLLEQFSSISLLTAERLALLGIAAALVLVPFAAKLKAFGLEFERMTPQRTDSDGAA